MADALGVLDEPVLDRTLCLTILRGRNEWFQYMATLIARQRPLPNFVTLRVDLQVEESNMNSKKPSQALVADSTSTTATPPSRSLATNGAPATNNTTAPRAPAPRNEGNNHRYNSEERGRGCGNGHGNGGLL